MQVTIRSIQGVGDCLNVVPTLRRLKSICDRLDEPLEVYVPDKRKDLKTHEPIKQFKNNPYADFFLQEHYSPKDGEHFHLICESAVAYIVDKTNQISMLNIGGYNIVDYYTIQCGFQLPPEEKYLEWFPDKTTVMGDYDFPPNYVVLHPSLTWPTRNWNREYWQNLINLCESKNIFVVLVGVGHPYVDFYGSDTHGVRRMDNGVDDTGYSLMGYHANLDLGMGLDLCGKTNLDEVWEVINNAHAIITCDTGLLHLSGTTDTNIVYITSNIHPSMRAPFRNGSQDYKIKYVSGSCDFYCASNILYNKKIHDTFLGQPKIAHCLEYFEEFECMANPEDVFKSLLSLESGDNKIKINSKPKVPIYDKYTISYWFTDMHTNIRDDRLSETSRVWLKFWDDMEQTLNISFTDVGGGLKPYTVKLNLQKGGVWWFDLPGPLSSYNKLGIVVIGEAGDIIYDKVIS